MHQDSIQPFAKIALGRSDCADLFRQRHRQRVPLIMNDRKCFATARLFQQASKTRGSLAIARINHAGDLFVFFQELQRNQPARKPGHQRMRASNLLAELCNHILYIFMAVLWDAFR